MGERLVSLDGPFLCHSTLALKMDMAQPTPYEYPAHWEVDAVLSDGGAVHIRPIRPDDAVADRAFFSKLSPQSVEEAVYFVRRFQVRRLNNVCRFDNPLLLDRGRRHRPR